MNQYEKLGPLLYVRINEKYYTEAL